MSGQRKGANLELSADQALVLFDWLWRTSKADEPVPFADQAEQRVFWDMECMLERVLVETFDPNYTSLVAAARAAVRDNSYD
jgi:hypothetical protein